MRRVRGLPVQGMDLVVVSPDAKPPVCKIINYDKLRYELEKKEKAKKKNQTVQELKEVKLSYKIDTHDYEARTESCCARNSMHACTHACMRPHRHADIRTVVCRSLPARMHAQKCARMR